MMTTTRTTNDGRGAAAIMKCFSSLGNVGRRSYEVFDDWLTFIGAVLAASSPIRRPAEALDPDSRRAIFTFMPLEQAVERIRGRYQGYYQQDVLDTFAEALCLLIEETDTAIGLGKYWDTIGDVYMLYAYPNEANGQYFTSYEVADLLAHLVLEDPHHYFMERVAAAVEQARDSGNDAWIKLQARLLAAATTPNPTPAQRLRLVNLLYQCGYKPITIYEAACGSGVLLLAQAARFPRWAVVYGLIRVYGEDIDPTCVAMARINMMLYGLNGEGLRCVLELSEDEITALQPSPEYAAAITEARDAAENGDLQTVREIANVARATSRATQLSLFEL